jgi:hypothetical protein
VLRKPLSLLKWPIRISTDPYRPVQDLSFATTAPGDMTVGKGAPECAFAMAVLL